MIIRSIFTWKAILCFLLLGYVSYAQVAVVITAKNVGPFSVSINAGGLLNKPESVVHIKGLDTVPVVLNFFDNNEVVYSHTLDLPSSGTYWYVLQKDRAGAWQLRYRGTQGQFPDSPPYLYIPMPPEEEPFPETVAGQPVVESQEVISDSVVKVSSFISGNHSLPKASLTGLEEALSKSAIEFEKVAMLSEFLKENRYDTEDVLLLSKYLKFEHSKLQFFLKAVELQEEKLDCNAITDALTFPHTKEQFSKACVEKTE